MYQIEIYEIDLVNDRFNRIDVIDTFQNLEFENVLNGIGGCSFSLNLYDTKATKRNLTRFKNQVVVKRNGVIVWFGPVVNVSGNLDGINGNINVQCYSYLWHLNNRNTAKLVTFRQQDAGQIAWDLIDYTQNLTNGDLFIREGTIQTTQDRDRTYENYRISDAIINLSNVINGYNFELQPIVDADGLLDYINFNVFLQYGTTRSDYIITLDNISGLDFSSSSELVNTIIAEGSGSGDGAFQYLTNNADLQLAYTRREAYLKEYDVSIQSTLSEKAERFLRDNGGEIYTCNFAIKPDNRPSFGEITLGDVVRYDFRTSENTFLDFSGTGIVARLSVKLDNVGAEYILPTLKFN